MLNEKSKDLMEKHYENQDRHNQMMEQIALMKENRERATFGAGCNNLFSSMSDAEKDNAYRNFIVNKVTPTFGIGNSGRPDRNAWTQGLNKYMVDNGITPEDVASGRAAVKFQSAPQTMQTKAILTTIDPLLKKLEEAGGILGNSNLPGYNRAVNFLKKETGSADIVAFNNLRNDTVAEIERGLMGTGVLSDFKYQLSIENLNSAQSFPQLKAAIKNTKAVIDARLEAISKGTELPNKLQTSGVAQRVKVTSPTGQTGTIPAEQLNEAIKNGYKQVQ
jgi:hypothetical protein